MSTDVDVNQPTQLSAGTGIAIAGVWLACAAVAIIIMMIVFVWTDQTTSSQSSDGSAAFVIIIFVAAPLVTAYSITMKILGKSS